MHAVVPCQWRRIIGSSSALTSVKLKKSINRVFFRQKPHLLARNGANCCFRHHKLPTGGILTGIKI
ncbi:hypothetical protein DVA44_23530 [Leclercia sp. W17]|nr:hypothetical protein DVA44_23530 [Leclercia sp. W17]